MSLCGDQTVGALMSAAGGEFDEPRPITLEWVAYRYRDLHRRMRHLENESEKYDPAVQDVLLKALAREVQGVKRALYGLMFVIVAGSVTFAFTVFALLGHKP